MSLLKLCVGLKTKLSRTDILKLKYDEQHNENISINEKKYKIINKYLLGDSDITNKNKSASHEHSLISQFYQYLYNSYLHP